MKIGNFQCTKNLRFLSMKKLVFGVISLIVLAVVLNGCTTGKAGEPPINANSCGADDLCEMNAAYIGSAINGISLEASQGLKAGNLCAGCQTGGGLYVDGSQVVFNSPITSDVRISNLAGSGNAYACLDAQGKLFRSNKPCIQSVPVP